MKKQFWELWLRLAAVGFGLTLLWHLSTFLPTNHEALHALLAPLFLGAFVTFQVGWLGLARLLGRLGWDIGVFIAHVRRHRAAGVPIAVCAMFLICSSIVSPPDVVPSAPGNLERDAGQPVLHSPKGITPISEEEFQSLIVQNERGSISGIIATYAIAISALYILREERPWTADAMNTDPTPEA